MMLFPGKRNTLNQSMIPLRNWWDVVGDFDAVMASDTGLLR